MEILLTRFDHEKEEEKVYSLWETSGCFNPDRCIKKGLTKKTAMPFSIVLPPPNVTGNLHMGHAAMLAIQDIMVRYARMRGSPTLWLPGTDHAAIATQSKVEQIIRKEEGKTKHDLGRENFLARVEEFAKKSHDTITHQIRRMGASVDWSREAYTLDEKRSLAVRTAFKMMYDLGLIYRGSRIVNWDPKLQTTVSDDEIEWIEEKTTFYYLKYGPFTIGTARPETKFGDKYVVVHPDDKRYAEYRHGQTIDVEWINGPVTARVIKDKAVDMKFGTGVMTITPWHDAADFEIAERHKLDKEQVIDERGKLLAIAGEFAGMNIRDARPNIVKKLKAKGLVVKEDQNYFHRIATSSRGGGSIEPQIKEQWFVDVNKKFKFPHTTLKGIKKGHFVSLKQLMYHAVKSKQINILPKRFEKIYFHWIENLRDWCISRQLWFGHRIPVWYCLGCNTPVVNLKVKSKWFFVRHGESVWNKKGLTQGQLDENNPLTEEGISQAKKIGEALRSCTIGLIISSDLERCRMTAEIIAKITGAKIIFDTGLRERHLGEAQEMARDERNLKYGKELLWGYETTPPGGETWKELEERAWNAFKKNKDSHENKNVVIVSHGGVIRALNKKIRSWNHDQMVSAPSIENAEMISFDVLGSCLKCGADVYEQDPDTLDTWFSAGLWTFSVFDWPKKTLDLKTYHPTSVLETGYDILFFWVARMILMTTSLIGQVPFRTVYLHGLVRDASGKKMSKSLGNVIDPLDMIAKYGADATRLSLVIGAGPGSDMKLSEDKVRGYRNFTTKIWNVARFVLMHKSPPSSGGKVKLGVRDKKHLANLVRLKKKVETLIEKYDFNLAGETLYHYFWHTFADKIIEEYKPHLLKQKSDQEKDVAYYVLQTILLESLKMLHPFVPFVTETLYREFRPGVLLMTEPWESMI